MVKITEELVRKKAEHNESEICTLEELSLHQEDIEKIEHLGNWCRNLEILLLQNNLISKIENLHKLKKLKYLNLAINNIEKIENLERLESLEKLDLTLNFIGDIESVCTLQNNYNLKELYLTGNPCTDYNGYRTYVVAKLPQLKQLDANEITRSEQLKANREIEGILKQILEQQEAYKSQREEQRQRLTDRVEKEISDEDFWKETTEHAPEIRIEMSERTTRNRRREEKKEEVKPIKFFTNDGRPLNINKAKIPFTLNYDGKDILLDIAIYKYLDTSLINVDLQPNYVRVTIKGKILQICLTEEICIDKSTCQRSQITGHLVITMPKFNYKPRLYENVDKNEGISKIDVSDSEKRQRRQYLEIGGDRLSELCNITDKKPSEFVDNPEVPPLE